MVKKYLFFLDLILTVVGFYISVYLFNKFFGMVYSPAGVTGEPTLISTVCSCLFIIALVFISFISGYKARKGVFWGIIAVAIISILGLVLFYIQPNLLGLMAYFYSIIPFSHVAEAISYLLRRSFGIYTSTPMRVIAFSYIAIIAAYIIGKKKNNTNKEIAK